MNASLWMRALVEELLLLVLGECIEVGLLAADSQLESQAVFDLLDSLKISRIIAYRRLKGRENPVDVLAVKDRIDVEGPEWKKRIYKRLQAVVKGFNGRVKSRLAYRRLTWQGLENASIHVCLVLMVAYAICIAAYGVGRPELRQSVAFFVRASNLPLFRVIFFLTPSRELLRCAFLSLPLLCRLRGHTLFPWDTALAQVHLP